MHRAAKQRQARGDTLEFQNEPGDTFLYKRSSVLSGKTSPSPLHCDRGKAQPQHSKGVASITRVPTKFRGRKIKVSSCFCG